MKKPVAYYNEIDPYAAEWLRNLILMGHIAYGVVDTRSITDIEPNELRDFTQCHFFAGIGVWSHALRLAGWPDDRPVWTGSCPCQPFSVAGAGAGFDDQRHLWPHWFWLISQCKPGVVFGEQVASKDGLSWLDLVCTDMEGEGYAIAPVDLCAAGVGAPHIRQRLYFVADTNDAGLEGRKSVQQRGGQCVTRKDGVVSNVADTASDRRQWDGPSAEIQTGRESGCDGGRVLQIGSEGCGMADTQRPSVSGTGTVADTELHGRAPAKIGRSTGKSEDERGLQQFEGCGAAYQPEQPGPTNGHWSAADWLRCRDGKWRPVEPGTFPLANGATSRVGRLRAYGNAIVPQVAAQVIGAYLDVRG